MSAWLAKAAGASFAFTGVTLVATALANKVLAATLGPEGLGALSLLRQLVNTGVAYGALNGQSAITQGVAATSQPFTPAAHAATSLRIVLAATALVAFAAFIFRDALWRAVFPPGVPVDARALFACIAAVFAGVLVIWASGVLAGARRGTAAVAATAAGALTVLAGVLLLREPLAAGQAWVYPALLGGGSLAALLALAFAGRRDGLLGPALGSAFSRAAGRHFARFAAAGLVTGFAGATVLLAVRTRIAGDQGLAATGLFDAAWSLNALAAAALMPFMGLHFLPAMAASRNAAERARLASRVLLITIAAMTAPFAALLVFRADLLRLFYAEPFVPAAALLGWLLLGEALRVFAWTFSYSLLAAGLTSRLMVLDVGWHVLFGLGAAAALAQGAPLAAIGQVYAALTAAYLVAVALFARAALGFVPRAGPVALACAAFATLASVAWASPARGEPFGALAAASLAVAVALSAIAAAYAMRAEAPAPK